MSANDGRPAQRVSRHVPRAAYPLSWRVLDALEGLAAAWPGRWSGAVKWLLLAPALLVVGLLPLIFLRQVEEEDRRKLEIQERARREMAPSIPAPHSERAPHVHRAPQYASRER